MAKNKNLPQFAIFEYDKDLKKWVPYSRDKTVDGAQVVTTYNRPGFTTPTVTIASAGTGQQGPNLQIPAGFSLVIKGRDGNTGNIYFAPSKTEVESATSRVTVAPGSAAYLYITDASLVWFGAANTNDVVELFVEK